MQINSINNVPSNNNVNFQANWGLNTYWRVKFLKKNSSSLPKSSRINFIDDCRYIEQMFPNGTIFKIKKSGTKGDIIRKYMLKIVNPENPSDYYTIPLLTTRNQKLGYPDVRAIADVFEDIANP